MDKHKSLNFNNVITKKTVTSFGKTRDIYVVKDKHTKEFEAMQNINSFLRKLNLHNHKSVTEITNGIINNLIDLKDKKEFTIVRFDFKSYFYTLSTKYILDYYIHDKLSKKQIDLFELYSSQVAYTYPGLPASNTLADIMTNMFVFELSKQLQTFGNAYVYSYVDDVVAVLDRCVQKQTIIDTINNCVSTIYHQPHDIPNNTTIHFDDNKFSYLTQTNLPLTFNNLGYEYNLYFGKTGIEFNIGIPKYKKDNFAQFLGDIVKANYKDVEKLRSLMYIYTRRVVTKVKATDGSGKNVNYCRLISSRIVNKYLQYFEKSTIDFLQNVVTKSFKSNNLPLPYYLKDEDKNNGYNLYHNIVKNRALVLNKKFGIPYTKLKKLASPVLDTDLTNANYDDICVQLIKNIVKI